MSPVSVSGQLRRVLEVALASMISTSRKTMKRPPPPPIQTTVNGVHPGRLSTSPSLSSKRPPSGPKQPPGSAAAINNAKVNSVGSRASNRQRQKSGDSHMRTSRNNSFAGRIAGLDMLDQDRRKLKKLPPQPYGMLGECCMTL